MSFIAACVQSTATPDIQHDIRVLTDLSEPRRILLVEEWTSREAYEGPHFGTPHLRAFIGRAPELFAGPPDITFWDGRGDLRKA